MNAMVIGIDQGENSFIVAGMDATGKLDSTALYTWVANPTIRIVMSPLDRLGLPWR